MGNFKGDVKVGREELHEYTTKVSGIQGTVFCNLSAVQFLLRRELEGGIGELFDSLKEEIKKLEGNDQRKAWILQCTNGVMEDVEQIFWIINKLTNEALKEAEELDEADVHFGHNIIKLEEAQGCRPPV